MGLSWLRETAPIFLSAIPHRRRNVAKPPNREFEKVRGEPMACGEALGLARPRGRRGHTPDSPGAAITLQQILAAPSDYCYTERMTGDREVSHLAA